MERDRKQLLHEGYRAIDSISLKAPDMVNILDMRRSVLLGKMICQLYEPTLLSPRNEFLLPTTWEAGWAPEMVWTLL